MKRKEKRILNYKPLVIKSSYDPRYEAEVKANKNTEYGEQLRAFADKTEKRRIEAKAQKFFQTGGYERTASGKIAGLFKSIPNIRNKISLSSRPGSYMSPNSSASQSYSSRPNRIKYGRGRPSGPSGKYVIPGIGPVGVYEFRKWLNTQRRLKEIQARQEAFSNIQQARRLNQQQAARDQPMESRTIPDTRGKVFMADIQREIDDAANALG